MKKTVLKRRKLVMLETVDEFEEFLAELDHLWEAKNESKNDAFTEWVNHYYEHLLRELGPANAALFS